jgi:uncharacterized protein YyaL (SSP411 family)
LLAVDWHINPVTHLVVVGSDRDSTAGAMYGRALAEYLPRRVVQRIEPSGAGERPLPEALKGMVAAGTATRGYACAGLTCSPPAEDLPSWVATLEALRPAVPAGASQT